MRSEPMHIADVLAALGFLGDDAQVTVSVRVGDLKKAIETRGGGPREMDAEQAAHYYGRTPEFWRRAAKRGDVEGAYQDRAGGIWRLPKEGCEAYSRRLARKGTRTSNAADVTPLFDGGRARGPRRKRTADDATNKAS